MAPRRCKVVFFFRRASLTRSPMVRLRFDLSLYAVALEQIAKGRSCDPPICVSASMGATAPSMKASSIHLN